MNDEIRAAVQARLEQKHLSRSDLARLIGKHPNAVTRALNGLPDGGKVPPIWADILSALDLRLTVEPGAALPDSPKHGEGKKPAPTPAGQSAEASAGPDLEEWGEV